MDEDIEEQGGLTDSIRVLLRSYLSTQHRWACEEFAWQAGHLEADAVANSWPQARLQHQAFVVATVSSAVAFLEASVNEVFQDAADGDVTHLAPLGEAAIARLKTFWLATEGSNRRLSTLHKFDLVLVLADQPSFARGDSPYQDADSLILLRNSLTHFKPEYFSPGESVTSLGKRLSGKFDLHPVYAGRGQDDASYLNALLSAGCARWAVRAGVSLVEEWERRLGLHLPYRNVQLPDTWRSSRRESGP